MRSLTRGGGGINRRDFIQIIDFPPWLTETLPAIARTDC